MPDYIPTKALIHEDPNLVSSPRSIYPVTGLNAIVAGTSGDAINVSITNSSNQIRYRYLEIIDEDGKLINDYLNISFEGDKIANSSLNIFVDDKIDPALLPASVQDVIELPVLAEGYPETGDLFLRSSVVDEQTIYTFYQKNTGDSWSAGGGEVGKLYVATNAAIGDASLFRCSDATTAVPLTEVPFTVSETASNGVALKLLDGSLSVVAEKAGSDSFGTVQISEAAVNNVRLSINDGTASVSAGLASGTDPGVVYAAGNAVDAELLVLAHGSDSVVPTTEYVRTYISSSITDIPYATSAVAGLVTIGSNISVGASGLISVAPANALTAGVVKIVDTIATAETGNTDNNDKAVTLSGITTYIGSVLGSFQRTMSAGAGLHIDYDYTTSGYDLITMQVSGALVLDGGYATVRNATAQAAGVVLYTGDSAYIASGTVADSNGVPIVVNAQAVKDYVAAAIESAHLNVSAPLYYDNAGTLNVSKATTAAYGVTKIASGIAYDGTGSSYASNVVAGANDVQDALSAGLAGKQKALTFSSGVTVVDRGAGNADIVKAVVNSATYPWMIVDASGIGVTQATTAQAGVVKVVETSAGIVASANSASVPTAGAVSAFVTAQSSALTLQPAVYVPSSTTTTDDQDRPISLGGVRVVQSNGIGLTSGNIYMMPATTSYIGGIKLSTSDTGLSVAADGVTLKANIQAPLIYVDNVITVQSATYARAGVLQIESSAGLIASDGVLSLQSATSTLMGGVYIGNGIDVNNGTISVAAGASAKIVKGGSGVFIDTATASYTVNISSATAVSRGGVVVGTGINVNAGTIYLTQGSGIYLDSDATNGHTINMSAATTASRGGVVIGTGIDVNNGTISVAASANKAISSGTGVTVSSAVDSYTLYLDQATTETRGGVVVSTGINVNGGTITVAAGSGLYNASDATSGETINLSPATTTSRGGVTIGAGIDVDENGTISVAAKVISSGSGITVNDETTSYTIELNSASNNSIGGIYVPSNSGLDLTGAALTLSSATTAKLGGVIVGAGIDVNNGTISVANSANKVISGGSGISVDSASDSYTVSLKSATNASLGGVVVSTGINVSGGTIYVTGGTGIYTASDATNGHTLNLSSATNASLGGVIVPDNSGLALTNGSLTLSSATATSIGGVIVPNNSGLSLTGASLTLSSATSANLGGVVVGAGINVSDGTISVPAPSAQLPVSGGAAIDVTTDGGSAVIDALYDLPISLSDNKLTVINAAVDTAGVVTILDTADLISAAGAATNAVPNASGLSAYVSTSYCPLSKDIDGTMQYADMFTEGGTATVTQLPGSTGYGTLTVEIQTITEVRNISSATNLYIPTERAVALALAGKQGILFQGACITISANAQDASRSDISVNASNSIHADLTSCSTNYVPTEYAVRAAINAASDSIISGISNWGSASINSYGVVQLQNSVDDNTGPSLPTAHAIKEYVDAHSGTTYIFSSGLVSAGGSVVLGSAYYTDGKNQATSDGTVVPLGGIRVFSDGGLVFYSSSILGVAPATVHDSFGAAYAAVAAGKIGGVAPVFTVESKSLPRHLEAAIVPTVQAVWNHVSSFISGGSYVTITASTNTNGEVTHLTADAAKATDSTLGVAAFPSGSGLAVDSDGFVTLTPATTATLGGVQVPADGGLLIGQSGSITLGEAGEVWDSATDSYAGSKVPLGGVRIYRFGGLVLSSNAVLQMMPAGLVSFSSGVVGSMGGVKIYSSSSSGGLTLQPDGTLYLKDATIGSIGGIKLKSSFNSASPSTDNTLPTESAIYTFISSYVSASGGNGKPVTSAANGGINVTDATTSYTLSMGIASYVTTQSDYTSNGVVMPPGGVRILANEGLVVDANGVLKAERATDEDYGVVKLDTSGGLAITDGGLLVTSYCGAFAVSADQYGVHISGGRVINSAGVMPSGTFTSSSIPWSDLSMDDFVLFAHAGDQIEPEFTITAASSIEQNRYYPIAFIDSSVDQAWDRATPPVQMQFGDIYWDAWVSGGTGGGGYTTITQSTGISVTGNASTGYIIAASSATTATRGAVYVPTSGGLVVSTGGKLTLGIATSDRLGGVKISGNGLSIDSNGLLSATGGGGGLQSFTVTAGDGISVGDSSSTGCKVSYQYDGPFAVLANGATVTSGYVKWLDGHKKIDQSTGLGTLSSGQARYLCGSSGCIAGIAITDTTYTVTVDNATFTRTGNSAGTGSDTRYSWSGNSVIWTPDFVPVTGTTFYTGSDATDIKGTVTAFNYAITAGGVTYSKTATTPDIGGGWYNKATDAVVYTADQWPVSGASTLYTLSTVFSYTNSEPSLPPAGKFYTMLAERQGAIVKQQQYGTVWHEHWGDDYKGQFAISRIMLPNVKAENKTITDTDNPMKFVESSLSPFRYIIGRGGEIYGDVNFRRDGLGLDIRSDGLYLGPGMFEYPSATYSTGAGTITTSNGLYPIYGQMVEVWLHIVPPGAVWPTNGGYNSGGNPKTTGWHFLVHTRCMEEVLNNQGFYAINLGWITGNGAPQQEHRGAIEIRGRWT